tara:strand:- start:857 stop:1588 length:732 start_codon:yes stop_codon:yes gene_type:complete
MSRNDDDLKQLKELWCCYNICVVPNIRLIKYLNCFHCFNLIGIRNIKGLKELECSYCTVLIKIPNIKGLKKLTCSYCNNLTVIPNIKGLEILDCSFNLKITFIPNIKGLKILNCSNCPDITYIPNIDKLKELKCNNCPNLYIDELKDYIFDRYDNVNKDGLKKQIYIHKYNKNTLVIINEYTWMNYSLKDKNIKKLRILYKYVKYYKLMHIMKHEQFISWYYSPNMTGGKRDKTRLYNIIHQK